MTSSRTSQKASRKAKPRVRKQAQYERFQQTARELGVDDEISIESFERAFEKIVPPKRPASDREK